MTKKTVVIGFMGTQLDSGLGAGRWAKWRPTVSLAQHEDRLVDRIELLYSKKYQSLSDQLVKDIATLEAAYDDAAGVTARFNKNLLTRMDRELDADFDEQAFDHLALWNPDYERIEMHLVSRKAQQVRVAGRTFAFKAGEQLHTENSHKFTVQSFTELAAAAGWEVSDQWIGEAPQVALFCLR